MNHVLLQLHKNPVWPYMDNCICLWLRYTEVTYKCQRVVDKEAIDLEILDTVSKVIREIQAMCIILINAKADYRLCQEHSWLK